MVFEYANRLAERGHEIAIFFDCFKGTINRHREIPKILRSSYYCFSVWRHPKWFPLHPTVKKICSNTGIHDHEVPDADIVCATAVSTAADVAALSAAKGRKLYFIQDLKLRTPETLMRQGFIGFSDIRRHHIMHTVSGTFPINRAVLP